MPKSVKSSKKANAVPKGKNVVISVNVNADEIVQYTPAQIDALAASVAMLGESLSIQNRNDKEEEA